MGFVENVNKLATDLTPTFVADITSLTSISAVLSSLESIHTTLVSLYTDKATLDSLYADKITLDGLYAQITALEALYANLTALLTVHADLANVDTVATNIANVNIVGNNIGDVNQYAQTYFYSHVDETALGVYLTANGLTASIGDMYFNTTLNRLMVFGNTGWADALTLTAASVNTLTNKTMVDYTNDIHADQLHLRVKATVTVLKGQPLHVTGYNSGENAQEVILANQALNVANGIATTDLAVGQFGLMAVSGVIQKVDTSAWAEGTILYVDGTGSLTPTEPTTGYSQPIAYVLRSNANTGALQVNAAYPKQNAADVRASATTTVADELVIASANALAFSIALG